MCGSTIGAIAKQAGVNIETLRYYERQGVVAKPPRTGSNYRIYPQDTVRRVRFVKRAQELGFSLKEIKVLLALRASRGARCEDVRRQALRKVEEIEDKIRSLEAMKLVLGKLADECAATRGPVSDCPILESLNANGGDER
jgi:MerR family mercuric resistance operon transcriptional regulator